MSQGNGEQDESFIPTISTSIASSIIEYAPDCYLKIQIGTPFTFSKSRGCGVSCEGPKKSEEPFKTVLCNLAYRAYQWRGFAGTQITADPAPPDRQGDSQRHIPGRGLRNGLPHTSWRTTFRDWAHGLFTPRDLSRYVQGTVTCTEFLQVSVTVITWADDIEVLLPLSRRDPAGTCRVSVPLLVDHQPPDQVFCKVRVGIQEVASLHGIPGNLFASLHSSSFPITESFMRGPPVSPVRGTRRSPGNR